MGEPTSRLIVALDVPTLREATELARRIGPHLAAVKIGSQLFTAEGPRAVHALRDLGLRVFLDLKVHDIPNTVAGAVAAASTLGVWMLNVHCSGGPAMLAAAAKAATATVASARLLVLGVTVLTSLDEAGLKAALGTTRTLRDQVIHLSLEAKAAGLDGVVASPHEIADLRKACGPTFLIVTPGVRAAGAEVGDQRRVLAPGEAIRAGADYVVVGRPILTAKDPVEAAQRIAEECRLGRAESREP
jgi:orotidine-5'-phosphate decarboxylase